MDVKQLEREALEEVEKEERDAAKAYLKNLYRKRSAAKLVVDNLDREIAQYLVRAGEGAVPANGDVR